MKYYIVIAFTLLMMLMGCSSEASNIPTAREVIESIKSDLTCNRAKNTVDTFKAGDPFWIP